MQIAKTETLTVALPRRRDHSWTTSIAQIGRPIIVRVTTADGLVGVGEAPVAAEWGGDYDRYYGETSGTARAVIGELLAPTIAGMNPFDIGMIHDRMGQVLKGHFYAKAAIDMACYDLMGKASGLPAHAFLGGLRRDAIGIAHSFGLNLSPVEAGDEAKQVIADGVRHLKVKVGDDGDHNFAVLAAIREAVGSHVPIHVDANTAWKDAKTALREIERIEQFDISWVEQPCDSGEQLAQVRAGTPLRVMADESAWTARDVYDLSLIDGVDLVSIYSSKAGGLYPAQAVAALCETAGILANLNGSLETGVGTAANLHFAAAASVASLPSVLSISAPAGKQQTEAAGRYYTDDIVTEALEYVDGQLRVPTGPGLGVELDDDKIAAYLVEA